MNAINKYIGITGEELPVRLKRIKNPVYLPMADFIALYKDGFIKYDGPNAWGSVQNNPCDLYQHVDGRWIECYKTSPAGMEIYYIESI